MKILKSILFKKFHKVSKRYRLLISVFLLSLTMLFSSFYFFDKAYFFVPFFILLSFLAVYFVILDDIYPIGYFGFFYMPILLSIIFYLFYFLFPGRWLTRFPFILFYGISFYANLLISNIFYIGVEKNLALYRAAFSVNFFYQNILSFFFFNILFSFKKGPIFNMILSAIFIFLLSLHLFWSIHLKKHFQEKIIKFSALMALVFFETSFVLSIIPIRSTVASLFMTALYYSLGGIFYHYLDKKLYSEVIREYLIVFIFVFIISFLTLGW